MTTAPAAEIAVDGGVAEERVKGLEEKITRLETSYGVTPSESKLTVADIERRLQVAIQTQPMAQKFGLVQEEGEERLTPAFQDLFDMLGELGRRQGRETSLFGWTEVSDISALRHINWILTEVLPKDLVSKGQLGHEGTFRTYIDAARAALLRGTRGAQGERVMHGGIQRAIEQLSIQIKGGEVVTGREVVLPSGGRLDVGMITDEIMYLAEVKTGRAGADAARQVSSYVQDYVRQRFMVETGYEGAEIPKWDDVEDWLDDYLGKRRERGISDPFIKGLVVAPSFTQSFETKVTDLIHATGVGKILRKTGDFDFEKVSMDDQALNFIWKGASRLGRDPSQDDISALWLQWLAGNNQHKMVVDILNTLRIPQEEFDDYIRGYAEQYRTELTEQEREMPGREEVVEGLRERLVTGPMQEFGAERFNIRDAMRTLVPAGILPPGWERRLGRTARVGRTIGRGLEGIADWIFEGLPEEERMEAMGRGAVTGIPLTLGEIARRRPAEEERPLPPHYRGYRPPFQRRPSLAAYLSPDRQAELRETIEGHREQIETWRRHAREGAVDFDEGELESLIAGEERSIADIERELTEGIADEEFISGPTPVSVVGRGILPVDIDFRLYEQKLAKKARRMGISLAEYRKRVADKESGDFMDEIVERYTSAIHSMRRGLGAETTADALKVGLKAVFGDRADEVIASIVSGEDVDADQWTDDMKKLFESVQPGGALATLGRADLSPLTALGESIEKMEDFEKYVTRLEPATGAFTIAGGGNCA